jgi:hypothetical protein
MVFVPSGIGAQLIAFPEATWGVAPALTTARPYEFNTESLELKKTVVQGKGLRAGGLHNRGSRRKVTNYGVSGGINMDLPTQYLNPLLKWLLGSKGQSNANLVQDGVTGAYSATHAPGSMVGNSMCWQKGVPAVDGTAALPFTYVGTKWTDWTISVATGAFAQLAINLDGRNELAGAGNGDPLNGSVPGLANFTEAATNSVFHFREATLLTGGTATTTSGITSVSGAVVAGNVKSAEVKYASHLDTERYFLGSAGFKAEQVEVDQREITGQFMVEWLNSEARYNAFAADTPTTLQLSFVGDPIGSGSDHQQLTILVPQIFLEGESPKVGGPAVVTQTVPFTGLDDAVNNPIQVLYWTIDATD